MGRLRFIRHPAGSNVDAIRASTPRRYQKRHRPTEHLKIEVSRDDTAVGDRSFPALLDHVSFSQNCIRFCTANEQSRELRKLLREREPTVRVHCKLAPVARSAQGREGRKRGDFAAKKPVPGGTGYGSIPPLPMTVMATLVMAMAAPIMVVALPMTMAPCIMVVLNLLGDTGLTTQSM